ASNFWGSRPLWQKIILGILLVAPPLALGIVFHWISCIVVSVLILAIYVATSVVLDDHYTRKQNATMRIEAGLTGIVEAFDILMNELEDHCKILKGEITNLGGEGT